MTAKQEYVPEEVVLQIIEAAPSAHWRLLIALGRSAGLRMVSEPFSMKWGDIDWTKGRITVTAPKTERRAGKAYRVIPLFPSIRPYLEECWDLAEEGDEYIFPAEWRKRAQGKGGWANANFRTQFMRIAKRAGIQPWPKLFNNLRASCATDIMERFGTYIESAWIGHNEKTAKRHYLMVKDSDFAKALSAPSEVIQNTTEHALRNALLSVQEMPRNGKQDRNPASVKSLELPVFATPCEVSQNDRMGWAGLEQPPLFPGKYCFSLSQVCKSASGNCRKRQEYRGIA